MWRNEYVLRTNLCANPSFAVNTTGWNFSSATGTRVATGVGTSRPGSLSLTGSGGASNDSFAYIGISAGTTNMFPGTSANKTYTISAKCSITSAFTGSSISANARKIVTYTYAASLGGLRTLASSATPNTPGTYSLSITASLPSDTTGFAFRLYNGSNSASDIIYWDDVIVEEASTSMPYFDGSSTDSSGNLSYRWAGASDASTSQQYLAQMVGPPQGLAAYSTSTAEHWFCDFYDLTNYAFGITKIENSTPEVRGDFTTIPQRNGVTARANRSYDAGEFSLSMWVVGCDQDGSVPSYSNATQRAYFERNLTMLIKLLGAQNGPVTLSKLRYAPSSDINPSINEVVTTKAVNTGSTSIDTMMGRQRAEIVFTFTLIDSFWDGFPQTATGNSSNSYTASLKDMGDAPIDDAVITITGPAASPTVYCPESDVSFTYNGNLTAGQTLVIDSGSWTARVGGVTNVIQDVSHSGHSRLMYIPPRDVVSVSLNPTLKFYPTLILSGGGLTAASSVVVAYTTKYQVV